MPYITINRLDLGKPFGDIGTIHKEACALSQQTECHVTYIFNGVEVDVPTATKFDYLDVQSILDHVKTGRKYYC